MNDEGAVKMIIVCMCVVVMVGNGRRVAGGAILIETRKFFCLTHGHFA